MFSSPKSSFYWLLHLRSYWRWSLIVLVWHGPTIVTTSRSSVAGTRCAHPGRSSTPWPIEKVPFVKIYISNTDQFIKLLRRRIFFRYSPLFTSSLETLPKGSWYYGTLYTPALIFTISNAPNFILGYLVMYFRRAERLQHSWVESSSGGWVHPVGGGGQHPPGGPYLPPLPPSQAASLRFLHLLLSEPRSTDVQLISNL